MPELRILLVAAVPPPYGGQEVLARTWLQSTLGQKCRLRHVRSNVQTQVKSKGKVSFLPLLRFVGVLFKTFFAVVFGRPDVLFMYLTATKTGFLRDWMVFLIAWVFRVKVMWHYPGDVFRRFLDRSSPKFQKFILGVLRRSAGVMVVSEKLKAEFEGLLPPEKIHVLSTSTLLTPQPPEKKQDGSLHVAYVGWISYVKGFYDLICALKQVKGEVRFDFVGEVIQRDNASSMARRFLFGDQLKRYEENEERIMSAIEESVSPKADPRWKHHGTVTEEEKGALLEQAHVLVIPSYADSFPLVILEAMSRECAVIVSRAGAMPEFITDGREGFVVDQGDQAAIADRLQRLAADPGLCRRMGQAGRTLVKERFDMNVMVPHLIEVFESARKG